MIAFFDLDKTLLAVNSATLWVRSEVQLGHMSWWEASRSTIWLLQYQLGVVGLDHVVEELIRSLQGTREAELAGRVEAFYRQRIRGLYRPGGRAAVEAHRSAGDRVVLLTSASCYLAEAVARELRLDDVLANRFEVDAGGRYTGRPLGSICYGRGKLDVAEEYLASHGARLSECSFYTDSMTDLPLLERVGKPVAVHPDPRLRRLALGRGWPVADWGTPPRPR